MATELSFYVFILLPILKTVFFGGGKKRGGVIYVRFLGVGGCWLKSRIFPRMEMSLSQILGMCSVCFRLIGYIFFDKMLIYLLSLLYME